jgi:hypothetical protein
VLEGANNYAHQHSNFDVSAQIVLTLCVHPSFLMHTPLLSLSHYPSLDYGSGPSMSGAYPWTGWDGSCLATLAPALTDLSQVSGWLGKAAKAWGRGEVRRKHGEAGQCGCLSLGGY